LVCALEVGVDWVVRGGLRVPGLGRSCAFLGPGSIRWGGWFWLLFAVVCGGCAVRHGRVGVLE